MTTYTKLAACSWLPSATSRVLLTAANDAIIARPATGTLRRTGWSSTNVYWTDAWGASRRTAQCFSRSLTFWPATRIDEVVRNTYTIVHVRVRLATQP